MPLFNTDTLCYVSAHHSILPDCRVKVETPLPIFPLPYTHASSFKESQSWGPAMKRTVGKLESSPAGQWNLLWFLSRNKRNLKKHTHSRELFRGENICHRGQNESPTKWNKRLWKRHVMPGKELCSFFHALCLVLCIQCTKLYLCAWSFFHLWKRWGLTSAL